MMIVWLSAVFNYFLIQFLINTFAQVYLTAIFVSFFDSIAYLTGGILYSKLGLKASICSFYVLAGITGLVLIFWGL